MINNNNKNNKIKELNEDIFNMIGQYIVQPKCKLLDWINPNLLDVALLSSNIR